MALVYTLLRVLLGLAFAFALAGAVKLTDLVSEDIYAQMRARFVQFASVFPLRNPTGDHNLVLSVVMMVAIFTLLKLHEPLFMCCPPAVFLGLLLLLAIRERGGYRTKSKTQ
ncbi:hypothetical protein MATL_G00159120 [Megalops atlanticus]|uniref:Uncharacterized protein n=1 Tax=Megalops atlanticus TaxID=7932 RepID=A0A9D3PQZ9_MEGAT|nr:hypothetical protein MATL_G00159120 [Megalops atlanticus]